MSSMGLSFDLESKPSQDRVVSDEAREYVHSRERKQPSIGGWKAASLILGMELCERLAFLGIGLNLVTYLHDEMHLPIPKSANIVTNFMGTSYLTALLGGFIADAYLGRFKTTAIGCIIELMEEEAEGRRQMQSYFNWFGASISGGGVLAVTTLVYLQDHAGRALGYGASATFIVVGLLLLLVASPFIRSKPPSGSAFTCIAHVFVAAWRNRRLPHSSANNTQFSFLNKAALAPYSSYNKIPIPESSWRWCSMEKVEDVKMLLRVLPILATTIVFWTVNGQALTFSIEQGATLDRRLGKHFQIPPASVPVVLQLGMLTTIPLYDRVLIPLARKWRGNDYGITNLQRVGVGLLISTSSMVVAAVVEKRRLKIAHSSHNSTIDKPLPMSIFYLTPQYALVGIGQAFAYVGQIDFFYRASPIAMRSLSTGLCLSTLSFGLFLSSALVSSINRWTRHGSSPGWLTNNLNDGRLDYFYWFLALLSFLSFLAYLLCSHWYKYDHAGEEMNTLHTFEQ